MNKAILMGRLTKDPEVRYTSANNTAVCSFTLAVDRRFVKPGEEKQADFIPIVAWQKLAEFCGKYFQKGRQVVVVGRIQTRSYDNNEGRKVYVTEVIAEEAYFADSKREGGAPGAGGGPVGSGPVGSGPVGGGRQQGPGDTGTADGFYPMENDDELPF